MLPVAIFLIVLGVMLLGAAAVGAIGGLAWLAYRFADGYAHGTPLPSIFATAAVVLLVFAGVVALWRYVTKGS